MKSPIDIIKGRIVDIDERGTMTIKAYYPDWYMLVKREYRDCNIQLIDGRPMSDKQRRTCYAFLKDIANFTGMGLDPTKEYMKLKFLAEDLQETGDKIFSLSSAPMSLVCAFQRFLVHFMLDWDIPCSIPLLDFVDDVNDYLYACLAAKKCCICGKRADLHHVDRIGMGGDRTEIVHEGLEAQPLCREHHQEVDQLGQKTFNEKYHLPGGITLDKELCRLYKLKTKGGPENVK
jgi:hypothetical protein